MVVLRAMSSVYSKLDGYHNCARWCLPRVLDNSSAAAYVVYLFGGRTESCVEL
jgi:hypothetical protein